jgi:hypothetical protein
MWTTASDRLLATVGTTRCGRLVGAHGVLSGARTKNSMYSAQDAPTTHEEDWSRQARSISAGTRSLRVRRRSHARRHGRRELWTRRLARRDLRLRHLHVLRRHGRRLAVHSQSLTPMPSSKQKVFCPACGAEHESTLAMNHTYSLCCGQRCFDEFSWRYTLSVLGKAYYPKPTNT